MGCLNTVVNIELVRPSSLQWPNVGREAIKQERKILAAERVENFHSMARERVGVSTPLHLRWIKAGNKIANDDFNTTEKPKTQI